MALRADAGYFAGALARDEDIAFAIGAKRIAPLWRLLYGVRADDWTDATGMDNAQVAVADYRPDWWPANTSPLIRRARLAPEQVSADPRSRRRRTLHPAQRALPIAGLQDAGAIYAYSFILTNLDVSEPDQAAAAEHWYRHRTTIESIFRDSKHGAALLHLPSGYAAVNTAWMWGALLAASMAGWLHQLTAATRGQTILAGHGVRGGKAMIETLRWRLIAVPGRLVCHAGQLILRLPPGDQLLAEVSPASGPSPRRPDQPGPQGPDRKPEKANPAPRRALKPARTAKPRPPKINFRPEDQLSALIAESGQNDAADRRRVWRISAETIYVVEQLSRLPATLRQSDLGRHRHPAGLFIGQRHHTRPACIQGQPMMSSVANPRSSRRSDDGQTILRPSGQTQICMLTWDLGWAQQGSSLRPLACKAKIRMRLHQVPELIYLRELRKRCPGIPADVCTSLHGGSRKWFPERLSRSQHREHINQPCKLHRPGPFRCVAFCSAAAAW